MICVGNCDEVAWVIKLYNEKEKKKKIKKNREKEKIHFMINSILQKYYLYFTSLVSELEKGKKKVTSFKTLRLMSLQSYSTKHNFNFIYFDSEL